MQLGRLHVYVQLLFITLLRDTLLFEFVASGILKRTLLLKKIQLLLVIYAGVKKHIRITAYTGIKGVDFSFGLS